MKRWLSLGLGIVFLVTLMPWHTAPLAAQEATACVDSYDEAVDYFPDKVETTYAEGFSVEYFNHYKVVTVTQPWQGASDADAFQYVLVQCGTPAPEGFADAQFLEVPADDVLVMSTTQLPHLVALGLLDNLVGLDSFIYVNTPEVRDLIEAGELLEVGGGSSVNVEMVLDIDPDVVMAFGSGLPDYDVHPALIENDVFVVINAEWVESSALARAEWVKFTSVFFNKEAEANALFDQIEGEYNDLVALTAELPSDEHPSVLTGTYNTFDNAWVIAGGDSYIGQLIRDAGGKQVFGTHEDVEGSIRSTPFDFETVYVEGLEADFWLPDAFGVNTTSDLLSLDERYGDFTALSDGHTYNSSGRVNENGGNDIYESGVLNPQVVLADLISIFHPALLPDHELVYLKQLQ